ncbi:MAG: ROK family protein [Lachnospirales bacterium]
MKALLPNDIKDQNRKIIYDILLFNSPIAKIEISKMTTMSLVTVGKIIDYFDEIGLVSASNESREGAGGLGRKRLLYDFNPNAYTSIGIQLIGNSARAILLNLKHEIIDEYIIEDEVFFWDETLVNTLIDVKKYFKTTVEKYNSEILGIGIAVDGAINTQEEKIRIKVSYIAEKEYSYSKIKDSLEEKFGVPIYLENDVNASAICEFFQLSLKIEDSNDLLEIALNSGIGSGIILNKKLYRGNKKGVGELEYLCFDLDYVAMPTSVGWLETKLNIKYLEKRFGLDFLDLDRSKVRNIYECVEYISKYIALTICNAVSLLDISNIVLSGPVIKALSDEILEKVEFFVFKYTGWKLNIYASNMENASAIGAATLSIEQEINNKLFS